MKCGLFTTAVILCWEANQSLSHSIFPDSRAAWIFSRNHLNRGYSFFSLFCRVVYKHGFHLILQMIYSCQVSVCGAQPLRLWFFAPSASFDVCQELAIFPTCSADTLGFGFGRLRSPHLYFLTKSCQLALARLTPGRECGRKRLLASLFQTWSRCLSLCLQDHLLQREIRAHKNRLQNPGRIIHARAPATSFHLRPHTASKCFHSGQLESEIHALQIL